MSVKKREAESRAQVRIARTREDGYWSYLGTDILSIDASQQTMNLDSFSMNTPDSEFYRVVRHETGHTLGFPHEHTQPDRQSDQPAESNRLLHENAGLVQRSGNCSGSDAS